MIVHLHKVLDVKRSYFFIFSFLFFMPIQPPKARFVVFLLLFFFQSRSNSFALGVDFIERADFNKDGSGQFSIEVDLTKTSHLISVIKYLNKNYKDVTKAIGYKAFSNASAKFEKIAGISQVDIAYNEKMLKFKLVFNFNTLQALNEAIGELNEGLDPPKITYFSLDDLLFTREDLNGIAKKLLFYQQYDNSLVKSLDLASFFKESTYTTIYTFLNTIQDYSNPLSELTKDKKTIRVTHHIFAPDQVEHAIGNRIHFTKN
ncbi:Putative uncharacterized protein [Cardinium endosymbiont cEper1 of Encarsia pergandiella]|uniref:hypothetical protein n=1 Tax=Cardinium endosymbiont of Encarsia pergandiella TaxID=249402 RepID=UPI00027E9E14|nr:hypothetical protein [Cardinium endosymbiont of Encarsia pergandiella]CCM10075.1 Putative uncharacterized protein [Cardinium endosymbiont cEper1 of Encarsia pergandiella]